MRSKRPKSPGEVSAALMRVAKARVMVGLLSFMLELSSEPPLFWGWFIFFFFNKTLVIYSQVH